MTDTYDFHLLDNPMKQFESNSSTSKVREWIIRVFSLRIEYGYSGGYRLRNRMMICHDHIDPDRLRILDRFDISSPTVDSDDERDSLLREFVEEIFLETISVMDSVREPIGNSTSYLREKLHEYRCPTHAIDIIVSEDDNSFSYLSCSEYPVYSSTHVWHEEWIMQIRETRREKFFIEDLAIFPEYLRE